MADWQEGDTASMSKTITENDVVPYAHASGDMNPLHLDAEYARTTKFGQRIAHGMLVAGLISAVIGTKLPGAGAIYAGQTLQFVRPVYLGDTVTATATIRTYDRTRGRMVLTTVCRNQRGEDVIVGEAEIRYRPTQPSSRDLASTAQGRAAPV